jgi:hypothetical protein
MKPPGPAPYQRQKIHGHIVSVAAKNASDFRRQCLLFSFSIKRRALQCAVAIEIERALANIENRSTQHDADLQVSPLNYYWYRPDSASSRSPPSPPPSTTSSHHRCSSTCSSVSFLYAPLLHIRHCLVGWRFVSSR